MPQGTHTLPRSPSEDLAAKHRTCTPGPAGRSPTPASWRHQTPLRGLCHLWGLCLRQTLTARASGGAERMVLGLALCPGVGLKVNQEEGTPQEAACYLTLDSSAEEW